MCESVTSTPRITKPKTKPLKNSNGEKLFPGMERKYNCLEFSPRLSFPSTVCLYLFLHPDNGIVNKREVHRLMVCTQLALREWLLLSTAVAADIAELR